MQILFRLGQGELLNFVYQFRSSLGKRIVKFVIVKGTRRMG
jgi:hypothetical protein